MLFKDRTQSGTLLATKLERFHSKPNVIVLGLPRGGVLTAYEVAKKLNVPLDIIVTRKIGAPNNPELAVGALTQDGSLVINHDVMKTLSLQVSELSSIIAQERAETQRRLRLYRKNKPQLRLEGKTAIIVDDGIATGATMQAAVESARNLGAVHIIVAVPVAPQEILSPIKSSVNELICLSTPQNFWGISEFYQNFAQVDDQTVINLLKNTK